MPSSAARASSLSSPPDGWALLAADDLRVARLATRTPARSATAGHAATADVRIVDAVLDEASGHTLVTLQIRAETVRVDLPLFGLHFAKAAALAVAVADRCGITPTDAVARLAAVQLPSGRATVRMMSGIRVIDDAYNAAPTSMAAALATLAACRPHRFAALGAMGSSGRMPPTPITPLDMRLRRAGSNCSSSLAQRPMELPRAPALEACRSKRSCASTVMLRASHPPLGSWATWPRRATPSWSRHRVR